MSDTSASATNELYHPSQEIVENANVMAYARSKGISSYQELHAWTLENNEEFWADMANELEWFQTWDKVLDDSNKPFFKWFTGAKTNIVHNAIDRHVASWRRNKLALVWEGEDGSQRTFSYHALNRDVSKMANVLKSLGVKKGDIVTIYLPRVPELPMAMLACAKIGAAHSVVYGGFSEAALADRLADAKSKILITADGGFMRQKVIELKKIADEAMARTPTVQTCLVVKRTGDDVHMETGRDLWLDDMMGSADRSGRVPDRRDGRRGYAVHSLHLGHDREAQGGRTYPRRLPGRHARTLKYVFDIKEEDRWWCAADPGWITGHSYIVYSPLIAGATSFMYEGAPNYPYPDRWWSMVSKHSISILYTAPTAIRGLMRFGEAWPSRHDLSSLRLLGSVGEPINPEAWKWFYNVIGGERCPIMDTWWQTETGHFMITPTPVVPLKPGSATRAFLGVEVDVLHEDGSPCDANEDGLLTIKRPWPGMMRTILNDPQRYIDTYWTKVAGSVRCRRQRP
jgi:acetyl-CoA synthetase